MGADAGLGVFKRRTYIAEEPPRTIAAAMKVTDVILEVAEGVSQRGRNFVLRI
jgi:hypothetical protein